MGRNPNLETRTVPCIDQESMEVVSFSSSFYLDQRMLWGLRLILKFHGPPSYHHVPLNRALYFLYVVKPLFGGGSLC